MQMGISASTVPFEDPGQLLELKRNNREIVSEGSERPGWDLD